MWWNRLYFQNVASVQTCICCLFSVEFYKQIIALKNYSHWKCKLNTTSFIEINNLCKISYLHMKLPDVTWNFSPATVLPAHTCEVTTGTPIKHRLMTWDNKTKTTKCVILICALNVSRANVIVLCVHSIVGVKYRPFAMKWQAGTFRGQPDCQQSAKIVVHLLYLQGVVDINPS